MALKIAPSGQGITDLRRYLCYLLLLLTIFSCGRAGESGFIPGAPAPDFTLNTLNGRPLTLTDLRGKSVLLHFWSSWCGSCVVEMPQLEALYTRLKSKDFLVVAVGSEDTRERLSDFQKKVGLSFPVLFDPDSKIRRLYKVTSLPESFLLDRNGTFRTIMDAYSGTPTVRAAGPQDWSGPAWERQIAQLLEDPGASTSPH